jgi:hypothetical protein
MNVDLVSSAEALVRLLFHARKHARFNIEVSQVLEGLTGEYRELVLGELDLWKEHSGSHAERCFGKLLLNLAK